jgi:hypothetical protein
MVGSWFLLICYTLCTAPSANPSKLIKTKNNAVHRTPLPLLGTDLQVLFYQIPLLVSPHCIRWDHPLLRLIKRLWSLKIPITSFTRFPGFRLNCVTRSGRSPLLMEHLKYTGSSFAMITGIFSYRSRHHVRNGVQLFLQPRECLGG